MSYYEENKAIKVVLTDYTNGEVIQPATKEMQTSILNALGNVTGSSQFTTRIDEVDQVTYIGKAPIGESVTNPVWQIIRINEGDLTEELITEWADGNENFDNIWNNRLILNYE